MTSPGTRLIRYALGAFVLFALLGAAALALSYQDRLAVWLETWLLTGRKLLQMVLAFSMLIFVHELGHFLLAKYQGVRVEVFSVGFGPFLISWGRGETTYALSLIPFGGYVRMTGQAITAFRVTSAPVPAVVGTAKQGAAGRVMGRPCPITSM